MQTRLAPGQPAGMQTAGIAFTSGSVLKAVCCTNQGEVTFDGSVDCRPIFLARCREIFMTCVSALAHYMGTVRSLSLNR